MALGPYSPACAPGRPPVPESLVEPDCGVVSVLNLLQRGVERPRVVRQVDAAAERRAAARAWPLRGVEIEARGFEYLVSQETRGREYCVNACRLTGISAGRVATGHQRAN